MHAKTHAELPPNYITALQFIFGRVNFERQPRFEYSASTLNLDRMRAVLSNLGDPHQRFSIVHVAGTKGKGSVCAFVESILRAAGFRTGLFTSPHLHTFRERIRINGALIQRDELVELVATCRPAVESVPGVTTFELITALALTHFARQRVDWVVLEVGLGGRFDATNVVQPNVTAITSISLDHMAVLGDTLTAIAGEKAGIIKPGVPVISSPQTPEALAVIEQTCETRGAPLTLVGRDWRWENEMWRIERGIARQQFDAIPTNESTFAPLKNLTIGLLGQHQISNAVTAIAIAEKIAAQGTKISSTSVENGLAMARWPARFEQLSEPSAQKPVVLVDGAHNVDSAEKLAALLRVQLLERTNGRLALIFGSSLDKDVAGILRVLLPACNWFIATQARHPRAFTPENIAQLAAVAQAENNAEKHAQISTASNVTEALSMANAWATSNDLICCTGSLFVAAEGREAWAAAHPTHFEEDDWVFEAEALNF